MFDVEAYLRRLGHRGDAIPEPTWPTLRDLHKRHLVNVAFDNSLNAARGRAVLNDADIDVDAVFDRIVSKGRGGVCFELSGLFRRLLTELGFDVAIMGGGVRGADGVFGSELEHMFNLVQIGDERWLVDVGYAGPSFLEPLRWDDQVQTQFGFDYRLVDFGDYKLVERKDSKGSWQPVFRFLPQTRELAEWHAAVPDTPDAQLDWDGGAVAAGTVVRSRAFETGQAILIGRRFLRVDDGREELKVLVKAEDLDRVTDFIVDGWRTAAAQP